MDLGPAKVSSPGFWNIYDYDAYRTNPIFLVILTIIILFYYLGVVIGKSDFVQPSSPAMVFFEIIMWGIFIFLLLINGLQYFFDINVNTAIKGIFSPIPEIDINVTQEKVMEDTIPEIRIEKQVFHIPDSRYTYNDAKAVCKAYGADLASYNQIEDAYNNKSEWCSYGWSKNQMIYYPTQENTFKKLQTIKGHEHDCGRPGVNGGFIDNPNARFGVNCYGYKPVITNEERVLMENSTYFPKTKKDLEFEKNVKYYRDNIKEILISPFNRFRWSRI